MKFLDSLKNNLIYTLALIFSMTILSCKNASVPISKTTSKEIPDNVVAVDSTEIVNPTTETSLIAEPETPETTSMNEETSMVGNDLITVTDEFLTLEEEYADMLEPVNFLKTERPKMYWFIVSWLKTNYRTPDWTGYGTDTWQEKTKLRGIDCSGFARVMQDEIFNKNIAGGSQRLLDYYCTRIARDDMQMGDMVFFRAPHSQTDRIVHVGVYLKDNIFVHATSTRSAAKGLGLKVDTLNDPSWDAELVTAGRIKEETQE